MESDLLVGRISTLKILLLDGSRTMQIEHIISSIVAALMMVLLWNSMAADAKPDGVPLDACETMNPAHSKAPQSYPCPYIMYPDKYSVQPNETVVFTLEAPPGRPIRGFMVQARVDNQNVTGEFIAPNNTRDVKVIDCCEGKQNTASHTSSDPKRKVQMVWKAPSDYIGPCTFFVTVAESHDKFWVRVETPKELLIERKPMAA